MPLWLSVKGVAGGAQSLIPPATRDTLATGRVPPIFTISQFLSNQVPIDERRLLEANHGPR